MLFLCSAFLFCVFRFYQFFCFYAVLLDISGAQVIIVLFYCWCSSLIHGTWFWRCGQAVRFRPPAPPHADALDDNNTTTPEVSALLSVLSFFLLTSPSHLACAPQVAPWPSQSCPCATPWSRACVQFGMSSNEDTYQSTMFSNAEKGGKTNYKKRNARLALLHAVRLEFD